MRPCSGGVLRRFTALLCALALCLAFAAPALAAEAPTAAYTGKMEYTDDRVYRFSVAAPAEALAYEDYRAASYKEVSARFSDKEIANSDESWLLYPAELLCEVSRDGETWFPARSFGLDAGTALLSLTEDLLSALAENGAYTTEAFSFYAAFTAAVNVRGRWTAISDLSEKTRIECPETAHIDYVLPEGADNRMNPSFLFAPPAEDLPLKIPEKPGFVFDGWQTPGGLFVDAVPAGTREMRVTARFTPRVYKIAYVLTTRPGYSFLRVNNGENPRAYTCGEETRIYPVKAPYGYVFGGWYRSEDFSGDAVTQIGADETGDAVLYARWLTEEEANRQPDPPAGEKQWYDLDSDGSITAADARIALRSAVGLETLSPALIARADPAGLGRLTSADARLTLRLAVGLEQLDDILRLYGVEA